jgi:AbrB family looped-hinge helix DNA binding protein
MGTTQNISLCSIKENIKVKVYGIVRQVDMLGRITIPKEYRTSANMEIGTDVEICLVDEGILIRHPEIAIPTNRKENN